MVRLSTSVSEVRDSVLSRTASTASNEEGQAVTEYILMLAIIVFFLSLANSAISKSQIGKKLTQAMTGPFAAAYKYGHPKALGFDEGAPQNHPMILGGDNNFRFFINPKGGSS